MAFLGKKLDKLVIAKVSREADEINLPIDLYRDDDGFLNTCAWGARDRIELTVVPKGHITLQNDRWSDSDPIAA